jgi:hypothetical protein
MEMYYMKKANSVHIGTTGQTFSRNFLSCLLLASACLFRGARCKKIKHVWLDLQNKEWWFQIHYSNSKRISTSQNNDYACSVKS